MSLKHMKTELDKKQSEIKKVDKSYSQDTATYKTLENEIKKVQVNDKFSYLSNNVNLFAENCAE